MNWTLFGNSLLVAFSTTACSLLLGYYAALWLSCVASSIRRYLLIAYSVPLALPSFMVTSCWLDLLGFNGSWKAWLPLPIYSLLGTIWVLTLLYWPISLFLVLGAWQTLENPQLESDPYLSGRSLIRWLLLPQAASGFLLAGVL